MTEKVDIILEGQPYPITTPLTLGQMCDAHVAVVLPASTDPAEQIKRNSKRSIDILVAGMQAEHPEITPEALSKMRITKLELNTAVVEILKLAGLEPAKETKPGEAEAETIAA